jgi:hypothetical protein
MCVVSCYDLAQEEAGFAKMLWAARPDPLTRVPPGGGSRYTVYTVSAMIGDRNAIKKNQIIHWEKKLKIGEIPYSKLC